MGSGRWDASTYAAVTDSAIKSGTNFAYNSTMASTPHHLRTAHVSLDPSKFSIKNAAGDGIRESRDNDEHPNSVAIAVLFDVTGSMGMIPRVLQQKLPGLLGLLLRKGYIDDPQVLFGAIGDATCDRVPLQIGQFESDNRMDDNLDNFYLEGGGGGQFTESYELGLYFMARHTSIDCLEKRNKKGYLFIIGDEESYRKVSKNEVKKFIGEDTNIQDDISIEDIVAEVKEKYEVYFLVPISGGYGDRNAPYWRTHFGQQVIMLDDPNNVAEVIGLTIGLAEGTVDLSEGEEDLKEIGASADAIKSVTKSLATVSSGGGGGIATVSGDSPDLGGDSGAERI
jgi:hypothetical protein